MSRPVPRRRPGGFRQGARPRRDRAVRQGAERRQAAARERQKTCGTEWRALTDAQKATEGPKWPQFWSKCNKRLKGHDKA